MNIKAEEIIIKEIKIAFPEFRVLSDQEIESNPYVLETAPKTQLPNYLVAFMVYVLSSFRNVGITQVYDQLLYNLNEYSKCKNPESENWGVWFKLEQNQRHAILAFLGHMLHNQKANIDVEELQKIIGRWRVT